MVLSFPVYFFVGSARAAGWPRKVGLFRRKELIDWCVVVHTYQETLELAMTLGMGPSRRILPLIADCFQERDWSRQTAEELIEQLQHCWGGTDFVGEPEPFDAVINAHPHLPPWRALIHREIQREVSLGEKVIPWSSLDEREFLALLHWNFATAMFWDLRNRDRVWRWLNRQHAETSSLLPEVVRHGLTMPAAWQPPTADESFRQAEEFVRSFEQRVRPLAPVPRTLAQQRSFAGLS